MLRELGVARVARVVALLGLMTSGSIPVLGQQSSAARPWGSLEPGPHVVGFRWAEAEDVTRWTAGEDGGPLRLPLAVWYPAAPEARGRVPMVLRDYFSPRGGDDSRRRLERFLKLTLPRDAVEELSGERLSRLLEVPTTARLDAPRAPGRFPSVIYNRGAERSNSVLAEYLASHGYVVVSLVEEDAPDFDGPVPASLERGARDLEAAAGWLRSASGLDPTSLAVVSFSSSSLAALVFQARGGGAEALISLEGWEGYELGLRLLREARALPLTGFRAPLLHLFAGPEDGRGRSFAVYRSLHGAQRRRATFPELGHFDFLSSGLLTGLASEEAISGYERACRWIGAFLGEELRGEVGALASAAGALEIERLAGRPSGPTGEDLWRRAWVGDVAGALEILRRARESTPGREVLSEAELNRLGYLLLRDERPEDALAVFRANVEAHPESANAHDSLGEAYRQRGQVAVAIRHYRLSLELDPGNRNARRVLEEMGVELAAATEHAEPEPSPTERQVVLRLPGMERVEVRRQVYKQGLGGDLSLNLYLPSPESQDALEESLPVVIFVNVGFRELPTWGQYTSWPRLAAASGMAALTYESESPAASRRDLEDLLAHLSAQAPEYGIDASRVALWACSANVRLALPFFLEGGDLGPGSGAEAIRSAVFYYGVMDFEELRDNRLAFLVARAGRDSATLNGTIDTFVAEALRRELNMTLINYPEGQHGFELRDDTEESRRIVRETLSFLRRTLAESK